MNKINSSKKVSSYKKFVSKYNTPNNSVAKRNVNQTCHKEALPEEFKESDFKGNSKSLNYKKFVSKYNTPNSSATKHNDKQIFIEKFKEKDFNGNKQLTKITDTDKTKIISLHKKGYNAHKIGETANLRYSSQQIAAVKAHSTMNNYLSQNPVSSEDKDKIIQWHKKAFNSKEILIKFGKKCKYNISQIAAIKAHATMANN